MRKLVINIKTPADPLLTKVRVYVSDDKNAVALYHPDRLVYDDVLVSQVKTDQFFNKKINYIGVEYYGEDGRNLRALSPAPRPMIADLGPWGFSKEDPFVEGDEHCGILSFNSLVPSETIVRQKDLHAVITKVTDKVPYFSPSLWLNSMDSHLNPVAVNGEIFLLSTNLPLFTTSSNAFHAFYQAMKKLPATDNRIVIGGFIWELDVIALEELQVSANIRLVIAGKNSNYQKSTHASNIAVEVIPSTYATVHSRAALNDEASDKKGYYSVSATATVTNSGSGSFIDAVYNTNATGVYSMQMPMALRYVGQE